MSVKKQTKPKEIKKQTTPKEIKKNIIEVPKDISFKILEDKVIFSKNEISLDVAYNHVYVFITHEDNKLIITPNNKKKPYLSVSNTIKSNLNNAIKGFSNDFVYKLQVVYSHFPITVKVEGSKILILNYYGEKKPRTVNIPKGVKVEISGREISISGKQKQLAGQVAGNLESIARLKGKDYRVFDDGIYIVEKAK